MVYPGMGGYYSPSYPTGGMGGYPMGGMPMGGVDPIVAVRDPKTTPKLTGEDLIEDLKEFAKDKPELLGALAYLEYYPQAVAHLEQWLDEELKTLSKPVSMPMSMPMSYPTPSYSPPMMAAPMSYPTASYAPSMPSMGYGGYGGYPYYGGYGGYGR